MNKIKSFIYLDDYKMYSISSQIFEGMTEYIIQSSKQRTEEKTKQKGEIFSGQVLADIIEKQKDETEKKFLHDYSYTLFENELLKNNRVLVGNKDNLEDVINAIPKYNFIKITSRIAFNDTKQIEDVIDKFNELGFALTYITQKSSIEEQSNTMMEQSKDISDRNKRSNVQRLIKNNLSTNQIKELAKQNNLQLEPDYLKSLKLILNYGYNSQFEVQMPFSANDKYYLFSSVLKRDKLKESELNIIKKHGRLSEKEFTIFGILTQVNEQKQDLELYRDRSDDNNNNMKEAVINLIFHLTNVESTFTGKLNYEYIIDPIAIYQEI